MRLTEIVLRVKRPLVKSSKSFANRQQPPKNFLQMKKKGMMTESKSITIEPKKVNAHYGDQVSTFGTMNLREDVMQGIQNMHISQPTVIQLMGIAMVLEKRNVFIAAQTGSGKTLVYAAPIINNLQNENESGFISRLSRPRALVLAPTRELAMQILKVFKGFSHFAPFRSVGLIGQKQKMWTRDYMRGEVDVVVGTPSTMLRWHQTGLLNLSDLRYLVLDEADSLMDKSFRKTTMAFLEKLDFESGNEHSGSNVQCIMTAATLPGRGVLEKYKNCIPNLEVCQSHLHKILPNVKHTFVKTNQKEKKALLLEKLSEFRDGNKCIVFCNTSTSCNWVSLQLTNMSIVHAKLHGNVDPQVRFKDYEMFARDEYQVMVCTDIASRGLDINEISLVVNFDCPFNTSDYLHRSGRTGRVGQYYVNNAEVVTYITQNSEVKFAEKIQNASEKNQSLTDIYSKGSTIRQSYQLPDYPPNLQKHK